MKNGHIELTKAAVTAVAIVTPAIKQGMLYANMLDMHQPSNALHPAVVDWISGNYNYKMGVARVKKLGESKYKNEFRNMSFAPRNIVYVPIPSTRRGRYRPGFFLEKSQSWSGLVFAKPRKVSRTWRN